MNTRRKLAIALGFIAFAFPLAGIAQSPTLPVIGYLNGRAPADSVSGGA